ncbi:undecaprenyl-phosphate glucose phosphotransferase [Mucilaginibacter sp. PPCGB 2223]|uniref:undecaprenyl-phosphate glucose phosphotransferase n=1 Tax=Mucilaginibacter sp. PPCGB 2223 TaxID=1886027 RepID=UPI000826F204|nr:undecaprenyl-phosphate glucose phosphotransferase [Mucilaginibacter sp. PPCGB 2223]OCX53921.1 undecaprenyl-phosphate glucose phosphotransferase [Mucilaginibacter sp. PPCGB 2223]
MITRYSNFLKSVNLVFDYLILNASLIITYFEVDKSGISWTVNKQYLPIVLSINLIWLLSTNITGLYEYVLNNNSVKTFQAVYKTYILFICFIFVSVVIIIGTNFYFITRPYLYYSMILFGFLIGVWKTIFLLIRRSNRTLISDTINVVIVGARQSGFELQRFFSENPFRGYKLLGFFDDDISRLSNKKLYLGNNDDFKDYISNNKVDEIFCALPTAEHSTIQRLMLCADKNLIRFRIVPEYHEYLNKPTYLQSFGSIPVIAVREEPLENRFNQLVKRLFDIFFSLFVIVFILSWLLPILAIIIKLESRGPVFFVQQRPGLYHKPFKCYKFRSMKINRDADTIQATKDDSRITRVGAFLRKTSLDELPQFFNTLIGNMSVVGPRPNMMIHTEQYAELIDKFMVRHFLKPGITGWAQVNGFRGETKTTQAMEKRVEADVWYLENWSFFLDIQIIVLTLWNILKGEENAF